MQITLKITTLAAQTYEFNIDDELTVYDFKLKVFDVTSIEPDDQRIIYRGRVLSDEKQLKEFDLNGKVLHVAERPPPLLSPPTSPTPTTPTARYRTATGNLRNSPLFRALDSMVVGTMAIPVNRVTTPQAIGINPAQASSSFCINRISMARHMLKCADNIAAYLENPQRGLNNTSLDILARGHWAMESTMVEVGLGTSDLQQNPNIVEMVQGAVSAALHRNDNANVTVMQLPTVFVNNDNDVRNRIEALQNALGNDGAILLPDGTAILGHSHDTENDESVSAGAPSGGEPSRSDSFSTNSRESSTTTDAAAPNGSTNTNMNGDNTNSVSNSGSNGENTNPNANGNILIQIHNHPIIRHRTGTDALADIIDLWRAVHARLNPFIQLYYDILRYEPTFETDAERERAQRIFDRVSEAFHYLSHAQHAISDLMLDCSQQAPRYLTCRPILVEQSSYVSSNNYLAASVLGNDSFTNSNNGNGMATSASPGAGAGTGAAAAAAAATTAGATAGTAETGAGARSRTPTTTAARSGRVTQTVTRPTSTATNRNHEAARAQTAAPSGNPMVFEDPMDEPPNFQAPTPGEGAAAPGDNVRGNQARVNTATLPTTSTQTRSTSRPQVQIGAVQQPSWNAGFVTPNISAFDRFLSCSSHHIREPEQPPNGRNHTSPTTSHNSGVSVSTPRTVRVSERVRGEATHSQPQSNSGPTASIRMHPSIGVGNAISAAISANAAAVANAAARGGNNFPMMRPPYLSMSFMDLHNNQFMNRQQMPTNATATGAATATATATAAAAASSAAAASAAAAAAASAASAAASAASAAASAASTSTAAAVPAATVSNRNITTTTSLPPTNRARRANNLPFRLDPNEQEIAQIMCTRWSVPRPDSVAAARINALAAKSKQPNARLDDETASGSTRNANRSSSSSSSNNINAHLDWRHILRSELKNFIIQNLYDEQPINEKTTPFAINCAVNCFGDMLRYCFPQYLKPEYDYISSAQNLLEHTLPPIFELFKNSHNYDAVQFEENLNQLCQEFMQRLYNIVKVCIGHDNAELYWAQLMNLFSTLLFANFREVSTSFLNHYLNQNLLLKAHPVDVQQYLVLRNQHASSDLAQLLDQDDVNLEADMEPFRINNTFDIRPRRARRLPDVEIGSEEWHGLFNNDWVPVIAGDLEAQKSETITIEPSPSDAYISGMAAKRRKVIQQNKASMTLKTIAKESIEKSILSIADQPLPVENDEKPTVETIVEAVANEFISAPNCMDIIRTTMRKRLEKDPNYKPEKFRQIAEFVKK